MSRIQALPVSAEFYSTTPTDLIGTLQQRMRAQLAPTQPSTDDPTAEIEAGLMAYVRQQPTASSQQMTQEFARLCEQYAPHQSFNLAQKQLMVGQALSGLKSDPNHPMSPLGVTKPLRRLQVGLLAAGQFVLDWSDDIFKKPDDEENQW